MSEKVTAHFLLEFTHLLRIFQYPWCLRCWARIHKMHEAHSPGCPLEVNASRESFYLMHLKAASSSKPPTLIMGQTLQE